MRIITHKELPTIVPILHPIHPPTEGEGTGVSQELPKAFHEIFRDSNTSSKDI